MLAPWFACAAGRGFAAAVGARAGRGGPVAERGGEPGRRGDAARAELGGCGVLAGALLIFLAFHRRQVVDLLVGLRVLKPKLETPEPDNPQTED